MHLRHPSFGTFIYLILQGIQHPSNVIANIALCKSYKSYTQTFEPSLSVLIIILFVIVAAAIYFNS